MGDELRTIADRSTTRQQFSIFAEYKHSRLRVVHDEGLTMKQAAIGDLI
jgi:hypothetical protein